MIRTVGLSLCLILVLTVPAASHATLIDHGDGLIYDTDLSITWYDYTYCPSGGVNWYQANAWVASLTVGGVTGWRLPSSLNADGSGPETGWNVTGSELGHLYYVELGNPNQTLLPSITYTFENMGPFTNLQAEWYWSNEDSAFLFSFYHGFQGGSPSPDYNGWWTFGPGVCAGLAVHDGDIAPVPEPSTILLLGGGLVGLAALRKR